MRPRRSRRWVDGNRFELLENGEEFFPRVFEAIAAARREVQIETFILFEDKVGLALHDAILRAAKRGVQIDLTVDGWGSPKLSEAFLDALTTAGVRVHVFDPGTRPFGGMRPKAFRRLHRKIVVVDGELAFVGGINYSADHLIDYGPEAKQDYAVAVRGPLVAHIHRFVLEALQRGHRGRRWFRRPPPLPATPPPAGDAAALFVVRDNAEHSRDIERHYRIAIRAARQRVVIANAYFFPGWLLLRDLRRAARRGVEVHLILQGEPDMAIVKIAAQLLYQHLLGAGVRIHEYCQRPLHGKVALADDEWSTVGSSNLDPLSLSLNLEANVVIRDREFNATLHQRLSKLMAHSCKEVDPAELPRSTLWHTVRSTVVFHFLRHFPSWAGWLPAHTPRLAAVKPPAPPGEDDAERRLQAR